MKKLYGEQDYIAKPLKSVEPIEVTPNVRKVRACGVISTEKHTGHVMFARSIKVAPRTLKNAKNASSKGAASEVRKISIEEYRATSIWA